MGTPLEHELQIIQQVRSALCLPADSQTAELARIRQTVMALPEPRTELMNWLLVLLGKAIGDESGLAELLSQTPAFAGLLPDDSQVTTEQQDESVLPLTRLVAIIDALSRVALDAANLGLMHVSMTSLIAISKCIRAANKIGETIKLSAETSDLAKHALRFLDEFNSQSDDTDDLRYLASFAGHR